MHPKEQCRLLLDELITLAEKTRAVAHKSDLKELTPLLDRRRDCWLLLNDLIEGKNLAHWGLSHLATALSSKEAAAQRAIRKARDVVKTRIESRKNHLG